ncbi:MAG: hypothetical protein KDB80_04625, partial [Planctomycetes bacterium]|nr:hypothetical protein [Planctomycetota bacterium]
GSILPTPVDNGVFEPEVSAGERTGNSLFCTRHEWTEHMMVTSGRVYAIDVYKFAYWFLTEKTQAGASASANLTLRQWVSEPLADGGQVDEIADATDRLEVTRKLRQLPVDYSAGTEPVELLWLRGEDPSLTGTLRHIDADGVVFSVPRDELGDGKWHLMPDKLKSSDTFLLAYDAGIATNDSPSRFGVGRFGAIDEDLGFPHGFEVQIVGPPASRRALVHLVVMVVRGSEVPVGSDQSAITQFSEL